MRRSVERATQAIINLKAISHNVAEIRKRIGNKRDLMAVVKADGYGHGSVEVSLAALDSRANCLGVALPEEGGRLRKAGIDVPILLLGLIQPCESYKVIDFRLEQTICSLELAEALDQEARNASVRINVHIKVDTGMNRIGIKPEDVLPFVRKVSGFKNLNIIGMFTHFSSADKLDKAFSRKQIEVFDQLIREIQLMGIDIPKKHMANSAGVLDLKGSYYDLVRPGIMIYGIYPSSEVSRSVELKPAMTLKTKVSFVKLVPQGTPIGYRQSFITKKETKIATIPIGYANGYSRSLSNNGEVLIKGRRAQLVGSICMDMCMIDVSDVEEVQPGDEVILFGEGLSVDEVAEKINTTSYEVLCSVGKRVPKIYVQK